MINTKTVLAVLLARGDSKGIPNKNIKNLAGKPLIAWSIEAAKKSRFIDRIIVSTDSEKIATVSRKYGAETPFVRPKRLATDKAKADEALAHALKWLNKHGDKNYDLFILLQPTSPLRTTKHIDSALEKFINSPALTLISVKQAEKSPYWMRYIDKNGFLKNFFKKKPEANRQDDLFPYVPNGAIYIGKIERFLKTKNLYENCLPYIMNRTDSYDIDEPIDLKIAELILNSRRNS